MIMDWCIASLQKTQEAEAVTISAERPKLATKGKTTDGGFVGKNPGAALFRPQ